MHLDRTHILLKRNGKLLDPSYVRCRLLEKAVEVSLATGGGGEPHWASVSLFAPDSCPDLIPVFNDMAKWTSFVKGEGHGLSLDDFTPVGVLATCASPLPFTSLLMQLAFFEGFMVAFAGEDYRSCTAPISAVLQAPSLELHALSSTFISNQVLVQLRRWFSLVRAEAAGTVAAEFSGCDVTTAGGCASLLRNLLKAAPLTMLDYMVFQQRQLKRATASPISPSLTAQPVIFATPTAPVTSAPAVVTPPPAQACIPGSGGTSSKQAPVCVWHLAE
jgi:hypothetical protein